MKDPTLPVDAGLLARFRQAASEIQWKSLQPGSPRKAREVRSVRVAHLHDEDARIETRETDTLFELTVDSGPVGALVIVVESADRGPADAVYQREQGLGFRAGLLRAVWGESRSSRDAEVPMSDLVGLARYALA